MMVMGHVGLWAYKLTSTSSCGSFTPKMKPTHQWKLYQHATKSMLLTFWYTATTKLNVAEKFKSEQIYLYPIRLADFGW